MEIKYTRIGDFNLPNLKVKRNNKPLNKYGLLKLNYIKEYKKSLYLKLLMSDKLNEFLFSVSEESENLFNTLMKNYKKNDKLLSEKEKDNNCLEWTQKMNNYKNMAEEIILNELIYN